MGNYELIGALEIGLIFSMVTMGVYLSYRISDFPDLTVDGSFPLGAALSAKGILAGWDPILTIAIATLGGALAGLGTAALYTRCKISPLLAGIISMMALYSVNLRIMGSSNISFFNMDVIFSAFPKMYVLISVVSIILILLVYFLSTEVGLALRASGTNAKGCEIQGINANQMKLMALMLSNALVAMAGALYAQSQGFADISMGTGTLIVGIASIILGEALLLQKSVLGACIACLVGALLYRILITIALHANGIGLQASDLNLITALLVISFTVIPKLRSKQ